MQVGDTTEHANFVVFDKEAEKLIKVPTMQLSNMEEEVNIYIYIYIYIDYLYNYINCIMLHYLKSFFFFLIIG